MTTHSGTTYVAVNIVDEDELMAFAALHELAAQRLGGTKGLNIVQITRNEDTLSGTFSRIYTDPEPVVEPEQENSLSG